MPESPLEERFIKVEPLGKVLANRDGESLLDILKSAMISIPSGCGGRLKCGKCRVIVEWSSYPLSSPTDDEKALLGDLIHSGHRLACALNVEGSAVIRIPSEWQNSGVTILTGALALRKTPAKPGVKSFPLKLSESSGSADEMERISNAIGKACRASHFVADSFSVKKLSDILRSGETRLCAALRQERELVGIYAGGDCRIYGAAFDIGTTTVVGCLVDLEDGDEKAVASRLNPQIRYGDDVISRISYCKRHKEGTLKLSRFIIECLNEMLAEMAASAGTETERIVDAVVVGNTVMHHLLLGFDTWSLSLAPYRPIITEAQDLKARDIGLKVSSSAYVHLLPLKAAFVGSDTIACTIAASIHRKKSHCLLLDIGTNGEIVLGNASSTYCCSTAAGPAFEGGHIRHGIKAMPGAIDRVSVDPITWEAKVSTIGNLPAIGICGSGVISAASALIKAGIVTAGGSFIDSRGDEKLRAGRDGTEFLLVTASRSGTGHDIVMTHRDIAEVQMAKAAIHAGAMVLWEKAGRPRIRRIYLAGAGGNAIEPGDAEAIGLIPDIGSPAVVPVGNAAARGAYLALVNSSIRKEATRVARKMQYVELSGLPLFQEMFFSCLPFNAGEGSEDYR